MRNIKSVILLCFVLMVQGVWAQSPLDILTSPQAAKEKSFPPLNNLPTKWWQHILTDETGVNNYEQLTLFADSLEVYLDSEQFELSVDATQAVAQFRKNIEQLILLAGDKGESALVNYELKDIYQFNEVFELMQQLHEIENDIQLRKNEIEEKRSLAKEQYNLIDQLIVDYRNLPTASLARIELGLKWLEARSWMALYEMQADQLSAKNAAVQNQKIALDEYVTAAKSRIKANPDNYDKLLAEFESLTESIKKADQAVQVASLKITESEPDTSMGLVNMDLKKLALAQNMLSLNKLELNKSRIKAQLDWINLNNPDKKLDDDVLLEHVNLTRELIAETTENKAKWLQLAQNILLTPVIGPDTQVSSKLKSALQKRTAGAQQVLLDVEELDSLLSQTQFVESQLTQEVIDSKSGLARVLAQIKSYGNYVWIGFERIANKPLFKINETPITLMPLLRLILIVLIGYVVSKVVRFVLQRVERRREIEKSSVFFILDKFIHYLIIFVATIAGFTTLGIDFSNLTLIAGALSVGIGFGLQNIVSNFVSGLTIMFERSLKVGDYIEMEDGFTGSVMEINARSTRINTNDNIDVIIPNSDLVTNTIINWTLRDSIKRVKIPFGVAYGTDKELVKTAAIEAAENVTYTLTNMKGREPDVRLTEFGDNSLNFILLVWVSKYGVRRPGRIKAAYLWELDTAFNKYGIEVPFPQRVVHYADVKAQSEITAEVPTAE